MSKRLEWDNSKNEDVLYMKKCGVKLSKIAQKLDLTPYAIKNFMARHKRLVASGGTFKRNGGDFRTLKPDETQRRTTVYEKGGSDKECASELGLTVPCFKSWRTKNELPMNKRKRAQWQHVKAKPSPIVDECFELPVVKVEKERRSLTNDDIIHYKHNEPAKIENFCGEVKIINNKEAVEQYFQQLGIKKTGELNKGAIEPTFATMKITCAKVPRLEKLITAKADKERRVKQFNQKNGVRHYG